MKKTIKIIAILLVILVLPQSTFAAIAYVQSTQTNLGNQTSPATLAYTSSVTSGSLLLVCVTLGLTTDPTSITDSLGQTFTKAVNGKNTTDNNSTVSLWYKESSAAGADTVSVAYASAANIRFAIAEYSGISISGSLDQINNAQADASTAINAGSVTTTQASELLAVCARNNTGVTFTAGTSYTMREQVPAAPNARAAFEDRIVSSTGTYTGDMTTSGNVNWGAVIATFKAAGGAVVTTPVAPKIRLFAFLKLRGLWKI